MGFFNKYPYTDFHELNLDWVLQTVKLIGEKVDNFINFNSIKYADPLAWNITTQYAANTVVIDPATGIAYLSTQAVPSGVVITDQDYWIAIFDMSLFFADLGDINDLLTTDKTSIVNAINEIVLTRNTILNPKYFNAACDRNIDDSNAIQAMFDYGASMGINNYSFDGINEISFKHVNINSDATINFGSCKIYGIGTLEQRVSSLFNIDAAINLTIKGGEFIGGNTDGSYNPTAYNPESLFEIKNAISLDISDGYYHDINNRNDPTASNVDLTARRSALFYVEDVNDTKIKNCIMIDIYGEESIYVLNKSKDREDINLIFANNKCKNYNTSVLDFLGNFCELYGNIYDYDYAGSIINCWGINVYIHDEVSKGDVMNVYDTCEENYFQNNNVIIENIKVNKFSVFADVSSDNTIIRNVKAEGLHTGDCTFARLSPGYGGTGIVNPSMGTTDLNDCILTIENIDMSAIDGNLRMMFNHSNAGNHNFIMSNCIVNKSTMTTNARIFLAKDCDVTIDSCTIPMRVEDGQSDIMAICIVNFAIPRSLKIVNNTFVNINPSNVEYMGYFRTTPTIAAGNISTATATDKFYIGSPTFKEAANIQFEV